jgi:hypothetical protein
MPRYAKRRRRTQPGSATTPTITTTVRHVVGEEQMPSVSDNVGGDISRGSEEDYDPLLFIVDPLLPWNLVR